MDATKVGVYTKTLYIGCLEMRIGFKIIHAEQYQNQLWMKDYIYYLVIYLYISLNCLQKNLITLEGKSNILSKIQSLQIVLPNF